MYIHFKISMLHFVYFEKKDAVASAVRMNHYMPVYYLWMPFKEFIFGRKAPDQWKLLYLITNHKQLLLGFKSDIKIPKVPIEYYC